MVVAAFVTRAGDAEIALGPRTLGKSRQNDKLGRRDVKTQGARILADTMSTPACQAGS